MPSELLERCERSIEQGADVIVLVVTGRQPPRRARMRLMPGMLGHVLSCSHRGTIVSVAIDDVLRFLVKHLSEIERWGCDAMDRGEMDVAAQRLDDYVRVRDRLGAVLSARRAGRAAAVADGHRSSPSPTARSPT